MTKLVRIMRMTESSSDGEALNALRLANRMLKAEGKTWEDIIGARVGAANPLSPDYRQPPSQRRTGDTSRWGKPQSQERPTENKAKVYDENIASMLNALSERRHDVSTLMFLASIREFYEKNDFLTQAQYDAIKRMHARGPTGGFRW